jgi:predicted O-linked N-acetylglucosamine transferase (SPINDLY family)
VELDLAVAAHRSGNIVDAERRYEAILKGNKTQPLALFLLGVLKAQRSDFVEAERLLKKASRVDAGNPQVLFNYANVLHALRKTDEALAYLDRAIALAPNFADAHLNRGAIFLQRLQLEDAVAEFDKAIAISPSAAAHANRGNACQKLGRIDEAYGSYRKAAEIAPSDPQNHYSLSNLLRQLGRQDEAVAELEKVLKLNRSFPFALGDHVNAKRNIADWHDLEREEAELSQAVRAGVLVDPFTFLNVPSTPADQLRCAKTFIASVAPEQAMAARAAAASSPRLRIGYISGDFHNHPVPHLVVGVLEAHDRTRYDVSMISYGPDERSEMRDRLKASCEHFEDVRRQSDDQVAALIRARNIDILVDLKGITDSARPGILARRAAAVQVNYLGYPGTMGAPYVDYIIADRIVLPADEQQHYTEKVVYLPDAYQANDDKRRISRNPPTRAQAGLPEDAFVFCDFNTTSKITPPFFDIWMRLLSQVEGSVLWLIDRGPLVQANFRREAVARGVSGDRLVFAPRAAPDEHLARHRLADLFLDTLPYNAHTTCSDALWAGLPVLTCTGDTFAGRVAASLLTAVGLPELVTRSLDEYERLALRIVRDADWRNRLKSKLAENRTTYPLFDTQRMARHIEAAYEEMWRRYRAGEPPAAFAV